MKVRLFGRKPGRYPDITRTRRSHFIFSGTVADKVLESIRPLPEVVPTRPQKKTASGRTSGTTAKHLTSPGMMEEARQKSTNKKAAGPNLLQASEGAASAAAGSATGSATGSAQRAPPRVYCKVVQPKLSFVCVQCSRSYRENQGGQWIRCSSCKEPAHQKCAQKSRGLFCTCGETYYLK